MSAARVNDRLGLVSALIGALALVLAVVTVVQSSANADLQVTAAQQQAQLAKAQALATLDNNLVQMLAKAAAEQNDGDIRGLLARNGVTFRTSPGDAVPATGAAK